LHTSPVLLVRVQSSFLGCGVPPTFGIAIDVVTWSLIATSLRRWCLARRNFLSVIIFVSTLAVLALGFDGRIVGGSDRSRRSSWGSSRGRRRRYERVAAAFRFPLSSLVGAVSPVTLSSLSLPLS
jgi:hypothetical protein